MDVFISYIKRYLMAVNIGVPDVKKQRIHLVVILDMDVNFYVEILVDVNIIVTSVRRW